MYTRESRTGEEVVWDPDDKALAKQAMADTPGTGISRAQEASSNAPVELDFETSKNVVDRYLELYRDKHHPAPEQTSDDPESAHYQE